MAERDEHDGVSRLTEMFYYKPLGSSAAAVAPADPQPSSPETPHVDPARRRRRRRVRALVALVVAALVLGGAGAYAGWALNAPISPATASWHAPEVDPGAAAAVATPHDGEWAISVSGGDAYLGAGASSIPATSGPQDPVPIASITKLITAMAILDAKPISGTDAGPTLTFGAADHALYDHYYTLGCVIAPMPTGSTMSERDTLSTMLVISACNYAEAAADWAFGSDSAAVGAIRSWLAAKGLTHTTIVEPTGIDDRDRSTPSDMIALGKLAEANPVIASIVSQGSLAVSSPAITGIDTSNTNTLLGEYGVDGIKTGTLDAGSDLLYSSNLVVAPGVELSVVGVVLDGASHESVDGDVESLLASLQQGFHTIALGSEGDVLGTYRTRWGDSAEIALDDSPTVTTWSDTPITSSMSVAPLTTGTDGRTVGTVTWKAGRTTVTAPIVLRGTIRPPSAWWRLTHPFDLG